MPYQWIRFLHIASAISFAGIHGASIVVLYAIRTDGDRRRIESILGFSAKTVTATYVSLVAVIATGLWLGFEVSTFLHQAWYWISLTLLAVTTLLMWFVAKPFAKRVRSPARSAPPGSRASRMRNWP